jgi:hypothetical protein
MSDIEITDKKGLIGKYAYPLEYYRTYIEEVNKLKVI